MERLHLSVIIYTYSFLNHDKTVILLKVAFNTINQTNPNQPALEGKKHRSSALEGKKQRSSALEGKED
jgi:hypothetical protein